MNKVEIDRVILETQLIQIINDSPDAELASYNVLDYLEEVGILNESHLRIISGI